MPIEKSVRAYCSGTAGCRNAVELTVKLDDRELAHTVPSYDGSREEVLAYFNHGHGPVWQAMALQWVGRDGDRDVFQGRIELGQPGWDPGVVRLDAVGLEAVLRDGVAFAVHGHNSRTGATFWSWAQAFGDNARP